MIVIGSDHGGLELKNKLKEYLSAKGEEVLDCGVDSFESVDYPDIAEAVCIQISETNANFGVIVCGTGIGVSIAANKINGIRAALVYDTFSARMAREHNDANVICMGGRTAESGEAQKMLDAFMEARFQGGRHAQRVNKIMMLEEGGDSEKKGQA